MGKRRIFGGKIANVTEILLKYDDIPLKTLPFNLISDVT